MGLTVANAMSSPAQPSPGHGQGDFQILCSQRWSPWSTEPWPRRSPVFFGAKVGWIRTGHHPQMAWQFRSVNYYHMYRLSYIIIYIYIYYIYTHNITYPAVVDHQNWPNQCVPATGLELMFFSWHQITQSDLPRQPGLEDESPLADRPGLTNLARERHISSGYVKIAIEHDHRNSGFYHWKWWFSIAM